jgi:predicted transcriptional regulator
MSTTKTTETRATVSSQVPRALRAELERLAREGDRTLSAQVRRAIHEHLQRTTDHDEEDT